MVQGVKGGNKDVRLNNYRQGGVQAGGGFLIAQALVRCSSQSYCCCGSVTSPQYNSSLFCEVLKKALSLLTSCKK